MVLDSSSRRDTQTTDVVVCERPRMLVDNWWKASTIHDDEPCICETARAMHDGWLVDHETRLRYAPLSQREVDEARRVDETRERLTGPRSNQMGPQMCRKSFDRAVWPTTGVPTLPCIVLHKSISTVHTLPRSIVLRFTFRVTEYLEVIQSLISSHRGCKLLNVPISYLFNDEKKHLWHGRYAPATICQGIYRYRSENPVLTLACRARIFKASTRVDSAQRAYRLTSP